MPPPKVSVIMPVYNRERYRREAIESIIRQTFTDFEFIIVTDASTDSSFQMIQSYDEIFACHFGRGATLGKAKYKDWSRLLRLPYINAAARKIKGYKERKKWLAICRNIIDKQAAQ